MKNVRAMFAAMTLGLILSSAAFAGEVNTPGYVPPPPPATAASLQEDETTAPGDISTPGFATELLILVLSAFYQ
jgi:hypothetical protein